MRYYSPRLTNHYTRASHDKEIKHESSSLALSSKRDIVIDIFATHLKERKRIYIYTDGFQYLIQECITL